MLEFACITVGILLVGASFALSRLRIPQWSDDSMHEDSQRSIARWTKFQRYVRFANNCLVGLIGCLVFSAAFVPRTKGSQAWILLWCGIMALVMLCVLLAMLDAFSSLASYRNALPEAARRSFSETQGVEDNR